MLFRNILCAISITVAYNVITRNIFKSMIGGNKMNKLFKTIIGASLVAMMLLAMPATKVYAYSEIPDCFDFGDAVLSIDAGSTKTMWMRATYDYAYFIVGATSPGTYLECAQHSGTETVTFHIGADEQGKNVFFWFYCRDDRMPDTDKKDCVEVYVQNIQPTNNSISVGLAGGTTGTLTQNGNISMLYNSAGTPMASFSLTNGNGSMASFGQKGVVSNGANYFSVVSPNSSATPVISASDKAVMIANGYAGVCVNGAYRNWP